MGNMTDEEQTLLLIRGTIASLPEDDQRRVLAVAVNLRNIVKDDGHAQMAFALVGAELAAQS